jgi:hypothetical protein
LFLLGWCPGIRRYKRLGYVPARAPQSRRVRSQIHAYCEFDNPLGTGREGFA